MLYKCLYESVCVFACILVGAVIFMNEFGFFVFKSKCKQLKASENIKFSCQTNTQNSRLTRWLFDSLGSYITTLWLWRNFLLLLFCICMGRSYWVGWWCYCCYCCCCLWTIHMPDQTRHPVDDHFGTQKAASALSLVFKWSVHKRTDVYFNMQILQFVNQQNNSCRSFIWIKYCDLKKQKKKIQKTIWNFKWTPDEIE